MPTIDPNSPVYGPVMRHLLHLQANEREPGADAYHSLRLSAYLSKLMAAKWSGPQLGAILGVSGSAVTARSRHVRAKLKSPASLVADLPAPAPPAPEARPLETMRGLRIPDVAAITAAAQQRTRDELPNLRGRGLDNLRGRDRDIERLARAAALAEKAAEESQELKARRARLAWSLTCYQRCGDLPRAGVWERSNFYKQRERALGLSASELKAISDEDLAKVAIARKIWRYPDGAEQYFQVACELVDAMATAETALQIRNKILAGRTVVRQTASGRNVGVKAAADAIGRHPGAVLAVRRLAELNNPGAASRAG